MIVTFTTARPAPAGELYYVWWATRAPESTLPAGCAVASKIDSVGFKGGTNARVKTALSPEPIFGDAFCPGPSLLQVSLHRAKPNRLRTDSGHAQLVGKFYFRVLRP